MKGPNHVESEEEGKAPAGGKGNAGALQTLTRGILHRLAGPILIPEEATFPHLPRARRMELLQRLFEIYSR